MTNSCKKSFRNNLFSGITETNSIGEKITDDKTDWKFDDTWNISEQSLFSKSYNNLCSTDTGNYTAIAFPNPCNDIVRLHFSVPKDKQIAFRIVDNNYNILVSQDTVDTDTDIWVNIKQLNISNEIIRVYYKIFGENCELRGHGDIQVN